MRFTWNRKEERAFLGTARHLRFRSDSDRRERDYKLQLASKATVYPPIRTRPFLSAFAKTGVPSFDGELTPGQRYAYSVSFLDALIQSARREGIELRDRLDAQSVVWWTRNGWQPDDSRDHESEGNENEFDEFDDLRGLAETQRKAVIEARRGQGQFREGVLELWGRCAVTGCRASQL